MKRFFVLLFALSAGSAMAQVPIGTFTYVFTNATAALWDPTGTYTTTNTADGFTDYASSDIIVAANGALSGERTDEFTNGSDTTVDIDGTLTGKVSGKGGAVTGKLTDNGPASGVYQGHSFTGGIAKGSATETLDLGALTLITAGSWKVSADHRSASFRGTETNALPAGISGDWTLETDITSTNADKLAGTGTVTLHSGRAFTYEITGTYKPTTGLAKLTLIGATNAFGSGLSLTTTGTNMDWQSLKVKLLGQSLKLQN
ncbi:MAG: hypothetical protein ABSA12_12810 [Verrucomicrobiia bacterium]